MKSTINFGSSSDKDVTIVHSSLKDSTVKHTTSFFRSDLLDWNFLGDTIVDSFKASTPTIYAGACSDGSEACSLKMLLEKKAPNKKFPIIAFDISKEKIEQAKKGLITLFSAPWDGGDYSRIKRFATPEIFHKNLAIVPDSEKWEKAYLNTMYQMTTNLKSSIDFKVGDVIEFSRQKFLEPCVFLFRNAWPYLKTQSQNELSKNLAKNLPEGSLVVIGGFDGYCKTAEKLVKKGFKALIDPQGVAMIFQKKK